jgi:hypothetical protein
LQAQLGDFDQAVRSLRVAVAEWSRSLEIAPGNQRIRERQQQAQSFLDHLEHMSALLANFEPLLQAIAAVAAGDTMQQGEIEQLLADLETKGWHLSEAMQRIWQGERDETALTAELDEQDTALVRRVLQIIGQGTP